MLLLLADMNVQLGKAIYLRPHENPPHQNAKLTISENCTLSQCLKIAQKSRILPIFLHCERSLPKNGKIVRVLFAKLT